MNKTFEIFSKINSVTKVEDGSDDVIIEGYASTSSEDRDNDIIMPGAWEASNGLDNYRKNPILLFNHNYNEPVGVTTELSTDSTGLKIKGRISSHCGKIYHMVKAGVLKTFSVGFRIKDAEFLEDTFGLLIKDAELFEISVVSVPANQDATFSVSKSFNSESEYKDFMKQINVVKPSEEAAADSHSGDNKSLTETLMSDFDLKTLAEDIAKSTAEATAKAVSDIHAKELEEKAKADAEAAKAAAAAKEKAEAEAAAKSAKEDEMRTIVGAAISGSKILVDELAEKIKNDNENLGASLQEVKNFIEEHKAEFIAAQREKFAYSEGRESRDWQKQFGRDIEDAVLLSKVMNKPVEQTKYGSDLMKAVNTWSGVEVSSDSYETTFSTNIERDIQLQLVLSPLFREITINSKTYTFPVLPDAGYAEFTANQSASGSAGKGNLDPRGDAYDPANGAGIDLSEKSVSTHKLISVSYLANETEEDAIVPILPLIRESMVRSHARGMEQAHLMGGFAGSVYGTNSFDGLVELAKDATTVNALAAPHASNNTFTGANLQKLRRDLGKYGTRPEELVFVVSIDAYYDLLEDPDFHDINQVGAQSAIKLTGQIGNLFGTPVIICDEFPDKAADAPAMVCVNPRNFMRARLRGFTVESEYKAVEQHWALVVSQRVGFTEIIGGATAVSSFSYGPVA